MRGYRTSGASRFGTLRGLPPPSPVETATYCSPSTLKLTGNRCAEPPFPEHLAGPDVVRPEPPVEITREGEAAPGRQDRSVE